LFWKIILFSFTFQGSPDYRSASPADTASHSAPQSPVSQNLSPASSPGIGGVIGSFPEPNNYNYHTQLQQEFSQITMVSEAKKILFYFEPFVARVLNLSSFDRKTLYAYFKNEVVAYIT
jgi:hypothetical protein